MANKKKAGSLFAYSTNPDFGRDEPEQEEPGQSKPANKQDLRIWLERHGGGKAATMVKGYEGPEADLKILGGKLKTLCGVGGTVKNGEILIQGDHRDKVLNYLKKEGYGAKKAGG